MWIEKYMFCTNVCGSICREGTLLVNLSHLSICNLIVCVHSCSIFKGHTHKHRHTQAQTHTSTDRHRHTQGKARMYTHHNCLTPRVNRGVAMLCEDLPSSIKIFWELHHLCLIIICCQVTKGLAHNKLIKCVDAVGAIAKRYQDCVL